MANITHEELRVPTGDTYAGQIINSVKRNFTRCLQVLKNPPPMSLKRSEFALIMCVPLMALSTVILPVMLPMPITRLICASVLAVVLFGFVGRRLVIVQSMSKEQTYKLTGALMGTFLFGLVVGVLWLECVGMFAH